MHMEQHITVMKEAAVEALGLNPSSVVVDATLGSAGHSLAILETLDQEGMLIALDADSTAVESAKEKLSGAAQIHLIVENFRNIGSALDTLEVEKVDAVLADLGWRMEQFSGSGKGFSFRIDEPLLMTYGDPKGYPFTARDIVNDWQQKDIANVLKGYGEEKFSGRIARTIVEAREVEEIKTSLQLAHIIESAVPSFYKLGKIHPATRTFQALRIAVNDELDALAQFINQSVPRLAQDGRLAIITFHSIEDRIVKRAFRQLAKDGEGDVLTKKPIVPTDEECAENPRARSAKLRIFQKTI